MDGKDPQRQRSDWYAAAGAALVVFVVYRWCLPPTITGEDSGELVAAAYVLGIPHPPGYPLWCLLAHGFTWLPLGPVAWRVALMSAVFGALTVFAVARLLTAMTQNRLVAFTGGLALGFSPIFWGQAVVAEVYTLNAFLLVTCLLFLWHWRETRRGRWLVGLAVAYGLGLANHYPTMVVAGPLFAAYILALDGVRPARWPTYAGCLGLASLGLLFYLYLPIRSAANPPVDWGNPETLSGAWDVVRRKQYAFMFSQYPRSLGRFFGQLAACCRMWGTDWTPIVAALGVGGVGVLIQRRRGYGVLLLAAGLLTPMAAAYVQNFNLDRGWLTVMSVFLIPTSIVTALGIGCLVDWALQRDRAFGCVLAVFCLVLPFSYVGLAEDKSGYHWAHDFARNVLESLDEDAIFVPETDHASFGTRYLQVVGGLRPDVDIARKYGYVDLDVFEGLPQDVREEVKAFPRRRDEPRLFTWLLKHSDRPVYFERKPRLPDAQGVRFRQAGLIWRALRPGELMSGRDCFGEYRWHTLDPEDRRGDHTAELILYDYRIARAIEAWGKGDADAALALVDRAVNEYAPDPIIFNNAASVLAQHGHYSDAWGYFGKAFSQDPASKEVNRNFERVKKRLERE